MLAALAQRNGIARKVTEIVKQNKSTAAAPMSSKITTKNSGPEKLHELPKNKINSNDPVPAPAHVASVLPNKGELESFWMPFSNNGCVIFSISTSLFHHFNREV